MFVSLLVSDTPIEDTITWTLGLPKTQEDTWSFQTGQESNLFIYCIGQKSLVLEVLTPTC